MSTSIDEELPVRPTEEDQEMGGSTDHSEPKEITEEVKNPREPEEEEEEVQSEEARRAKGAVVPELPSHEEREEHMLTHTPYRSWCRRCVKGKAKGKPHFRSTGEERDYHVL